MTKRATSTNKRWLIWLHLLSITAWLAFFGDKTPISTVALPPSVKLGVSQPDSLAGRTTASYANKSNMVISNRITLATTRQLPSKGDIKVIEILLPREQLILNVRTRPLQARDLFASGGWTPAPAPVKPLLPPAPIAPNLPFTYLGKKLEGSAWEVFLARGELSYVVREGSVLENTYRVDTIRPPNMNLTYLPLGQSQSLIIGDSQ